MRTVRHFLLAILAVVACACNSNDGDIGHFYGQWAMTSFTIDGVEADVDITDFYWRFQNNIVQITELDGWYETFDTFGTWSQSGQTLALDFTHRQTDIPNDTWRYSPPAQLGLARNAVTELAIEKITSSALVLSWTDAHGRKLRYTLKKLN